MSLKFLKLLPLVLAGQAAVAQTVSAPAATPAPSATQPLAASASTTAPRYELKRRSEFSLATQSRAPFWPIGWTKQGPSAIVEKKVDVDDEMFKVTSILLGNPSMAVINGRSYEEGQFIRMPKAAPGTAQVRPRLYRIGDGQVLIQVQNQVVPVPLRRPELNEIKRDMELFNEEKDDPLPVPNAAVKSASSR